MPRHQAGRIPLVGGAVEERGIDVVLTAQTNFGNGYPERNIDTGAFTYDFDKCNVHENRMAQEIQERYLMQLAEHVII